MIFDISSGFGQTLNSIFGVTFAEIDDNEFLIEIFAIIFCRPRTSGSLERGRRVIMIAEAEKTHRAKLSRSVAAAAAA